MQKATRGMDLDLSDLARKLKVCPSNIWFYFNGQRKWALETWLDTLAYLKILQVRDFKEIVIRVPIDKKMAERFFYLYHLSDKKPEQPK